MAAILNAANLLRVGASERTKKDPAQGEEKSAGARFWDRLATNPQCLCARSLHAEIIAPISVRPRTERRSICRLHQ